jgi:TPR repeat protein
MLLRSAAPSAAATPGTPTIDQNMAMAAAAAAREDWEDALGIWVRHAHAGVARAQAEIGRCFVNGWGVSRDTGLAERWLTSAANAGDALGQSLLADFHFNGETGTPNRAIAEEWYARAARQGDAHAQDMLSWMLVDGDHRKPDYSQAMEWALKAADPTTAKRWSGP